jgi:hypothetical protein
VDRTMLKVTWMPSAMCSTVRKHIAQQREIVAQLEHRHREPPPSNSARAINGNGRCAEASHGRQGPVARAAPALRTSNAVAVRECPLQLADVRR